MKRILTLLIILILIQGAILVAASKGVEESGKEKAQKIKENVTAKEVKEVGKGKDKEENATAQKPGKEKQEENATQEKQKLGAINLTELKERIRERKQEMNKTLQGLGKDKQKVYRNQNTVRLAVHSLLAMNLTGGIGRNVSQIAREFNNSIQSTIRAEERILARGRLVKFLLGGDEEAAEELEMEASRNQLRIQQLKQLVEECDCSEELKTMAQEQIQNMEPEQIRLGELAKNEKKSKGLLGWLFKPWK